MIGQVFGKENSNYMNFGRTILRSIAPLQKDDIFEAKEAKKRFGYKHLFVLSIETHFVGPNNVKSV